MLSTLLLLCSLLALGSTWNQPSSCYVRQSPCSDSSEELRKIREVLEVIADRLVCDTTAPTSTQPQPTESPTATEPSLPTTESATTEVGTIENPASSCSNISGDRPSGEYWIQPGNASSPIQVYCDTRQRSCSCDTDGGWARVANINMTDSSQSCPSEFSLTTRTEPPLRTCGRPASQTGCVSTSFQVHGIEYSYVCGRVIGYQIGFPDAFHSSLTYREQLDSSYLSGVSITHGLPRQHIWSFAGAVGEEYTDVTTICPCTRSDTTSNAPPPTFIGQDYFCDTGFNGSIPSQGMFLADDPLWDGQGCGGTSTCCEFNNPPWFCKQLPQPTTDDIELRLCERDWPSSSVDTPFEIVEMYIK